MYYVYFLALIILFCHLLNWIKGKVPLFTNNRLTFPLLLFYLSQLISTFFSVDIHTSIFGYYSRLNGGLLSLTSYLVFYFILSIYLTPQLKNKIISISLISGLLVSLYGIIEHFGIDKNYWVQDVQSRVFSTLGQPNWLAAYLCILLPLAIDKYLLSKTFLQKSSFLFLTFNFYFCLLFTKSKSGIIAAIISLVIYFIIKFFQKTPFKFLVLPLLFFLFTSITISNPIKDYLFPQKTVPTPSSETTLNITPSGDIRKIVWQGSLDLWKKFPLFGTGPETFAFSYYWTRPSAHNLTSEWDFLYNKAHNEYLNYLATTGTFGFITYLFLIISIIITLLNFPALLVAFISILITNIAGFSVVITSLYFFLLPTFTQETLTSTTSKTKPKLFYLLIIPLFLFLLYKLLSLLVADIAYSNSQTLSNRQNYSSAKDFINISLYFRPQEAIYHSQASLIDAQLKDYPNAIAHSNLALKLSPASTNLWKERAQVFSLISLSDTKYFSYAIEALEKCALLAPTDAKTFYLLGRFYDAAQDKDSSIKNYLKALELKNNYDHATFALGEIYFAKKNYSEAKKYFDLTLQIAPSNASAQKYLDQIKKYQ